MSTLNTIDQAVDSNDPEWVAEHPEVLAAAPAWVNYIGIHEDSRGAIEIGYERRAGSVEIAINATWRDGAVTLQEHPQPTLFFQENEATVDADSLRRIAQDYLAAATAVEQTTGEIPQSGSSSACPVYAWCDSDHAKDEDAKDASWHQQAHKGGPLRYDFVTDDEGPRIVIIENLEWSMKPGEEHEIDEVVASLLRMKLEWSAFQHALSSTDPAKVGE